MAKKWIQTLRHGTFTKWCKAHGYKGVTDAAIAQGMRSKDPKVRKMAVAARTLRHLHRKR